MAAYYKNVGNTVRVIEPEPPEERKQAVKRKTAVKVRIRRAVRFVYNNDHKHKLSAATLITLALIFAGAAGTAASYAKVSLAQQNVAALTNRLRETQSQNEALAAEVTRYGDAISIKNIAEDELGMSAPKPYQIVHINVPEENYAEYSR